LTITNKKSPDGLEAGVAHRNSCGAGRGALRSALLSTTILGGAWLGAGPAHAVDGMWVAAPATADWNTGTNWSSSPAVPDGTAKFGASTKTSLTFSAASTSIGTLQFNAGAPAYTFTLTANRLTINGAGIINNSSNAISLNAAGFLLFSNSSTAASATINGVGGSAIGFGNSSSAGNARINSAAGNVLEFFDSSTATNAHITFAPRVGSASFGNGFFNFSSAGNAVITNANMFSFVDASTAANATITNNAGGQLGFGTFVSGIDMGMPFFDTDIGTGSAGNATIINNAGGSTVFSNQSTAGTATITNNAGGALLFVNAGRSPVDPDASTARVVNNAGGTVDISQVTTGTSIGSLSGAGNVFLGSKTLTLGNLNSNDTISGVIADGGTGGGGGGELVKIGTGNLTLANVETYTGATMLGGGTLTVNGSIASSSGVAVNSGGTLAGIGTVAATTVKAGGTLAPGNGSVGTLTVNGNLAFNGGSIFLIDVTPTASSKVQVNGAANLGGTVEAVFLPGSYLTNSYTILTATGGRNGTFADLITVDLPVFLTASLTYDPNDVMLVTLHSNLNRPGLTANESAVAAALDNSFNSGHGTLSGLSFVPASQLPAALSTLSGEGTSGTQETAFGAGDLFLTAMMEQGQFWRSGTGAAGATYAPMSYASDPSQAPVFKAMPVEAPSLPPEPLYRAWFAGFDGAWRLDGQADVGSADLKHSTAGGAAGLDYQVNPDLLVGVAAGGGTSTFSVPDRATSGGRPRRRPSRHLRRSAVGRLVRGRRARVQRVRQQDHPYHRRRWADRDRDWQLQQRHAQRPLRGGLQADFQRLRLDAIRGRAVR
jgi:autotransporter-associated beta strand protein